MAIQTSLPNEFAAARDEVLVGILNHPRDLAIVRDRHWYRIPVASADKWLKRRWPPRWLAFYQTKVFGADAFAIRYFARVLSITSALRRELFPCEPPGPKQNQRYYKLLLGPLRPLDRPIPSRRWRRIVFINTTWQKFMEAREINDLFDESPMEDRLWAELKSHQLTPERQEFITVGNEDYALDFAFYCVAGKLDVETDGDTWHADPRRIPLDNQRDNNLEIAGWKLLRFNTKQLNERMAEDCLPKIVKIVEKLGGISDHRMIPPDIRLDGGPSQMSLFDDAP
jgi:very-short-patch-repair endonuclease